MTTKRDVMLSIIGIILFGIYIYLIAPIMWELPNNDLIKLLLFLTLMPLGTHFYCVVMLGRIVSYAMRNMTKEEAIGYLKFQATRDGYYIK